MANKETIYKISVTKETYTEKSPVNTEEGRRRELLKKFYKKIITEEVLNELNKKVEESDEYITEYGDEFRKENSIIGCSGLKMSSEERTTEKVSELISKYPLYSTPQMTIYQQYGTGKNKQSTKTNKFKKHEIISKLKEEYMDSPELP